MIDIGRFNKLSVVRKADFGVYLNANTGKTDDDILLPKGSTNDKELNIGDEVDAFVYKDSKDRPIATLKSPFATVGELAFLEVVSVTSIGAFVYFGLERDVFVPMQEQMYRLQVGKKYLFYIYLDKSSRIAATTNIDRYLENPEDLKVGDEVTGIVYGYQTNGSMMIAIDKTYKGIVLKNEVFVDINPGEEVKLRVKKYYDDGIIGLTPRQPRMYERDILETKIVEYLESHGGTMNLNDKSSPEAIKEVFGTSKSYFKNALGGLMKKKQITQTETETKLKK